MRFSPASITFALTLMLSVFVDTSLAQSGSRSFAPQSIGSAASSASSAASSFAQPSLGQPSFGPNVVEPNFSQPSFNSNNFAQPSFGSGNFAQQSFGSTAPASGFQSMGAPLYNSNTAFAPGSGYAPATGYSAATTYPNVAPVANTGSRHCGGGCGGCGGGTAAAQSVADLTILHPVYLPETPFLKLAAPMDAHYLAAGVVTRITFEI